MYDEGIGGPVDRERAFSLYLKVASQSAHATLELSYEIGCRYLAGEGVAQNDRLAVEWLSKSNAAAAKTVLGECYANGRGVPQNLKRARELFKAASPDDPRAVYRLGEFYEKGVGVEVDNVQMFKHYKRAALRGFDLAMLSLGDAYYDGRGVERNLDEMVKWYRKAAKKGNDQAMYNLGWCYENETGVPRDLDQATDSYLQAAAIGNADAMVALGDLHRDPPDNWRKPDFKAAMTWYRQAAELGNASACCNIGDMYRDGVGVTTDMNEAVRWYMQGGDDPTAMGRLGWCYLHGHGIQGNPANFHEQAMHLLRRAANNGDEVAMIYLANAYENGEGGLPMNLELALQWYKKAVDAGMENCENDVRRVEASMTSHAHPGQTASTAARKKRRTGNDGASVAHAEEPVIATQSQRLWSVEAVRSEGKRPRQLSKRPSDGILSSPVWPIAAAPTRPSHEQPPRNSSESTDTSNTGSAGSNSRGRDIGKASGTKGQEATTAALPVQDDRVRLRQPAGAPTAAATSAAAPTLTTAAMAGPVSARPPTVPALITNAGAPSTWTQAQVGDWLRTVGLPNLQDTFLVNEIDGRALMQLTSEDWVQTVRPVGPRRLLILALDKLRAATNT